VYPLWQAVSVVAINALDTSALTSLDVIEKTLLFDRLSGESWYSNEYIGAYAINLLKPCKVTLNNPLF
jgi:hypothetical protein